MVTTFDGDNLLITLTAGGAVHTVDAQADLYSEWKRWVNTDVGSSSKYPPAFRTTGGDPLTPGIDAGAYFFLRNDLGWRIKPAEEDSTITLVGNLAPEDSAIPVFNPTDGAFTVAILGLQPITQSVGDILEIAQRQQYGGVVHYDADAATSGTDEPFGTAAFPVNNEADLLVVAAREGITRVNLNGTLTLTQSYDGWAFFGDNLENDRVVLNGQSVNNASFENLRINGAGTNDSVTIRLCSLHGVSGLGGNWHDVGFADTVTFTTLHTIVHNGYSEVPGTGRPVADCNSVAVDLAFRGWIGGLEVQNLNTVGADVTIDGDPVRLRFTATCTSNAVCVVGGSGTIDSNLGTIAPVIGSLIEVDDIIRIKKATAYRQRTNDATGQLDIFDDNDVLDQSVPIYEDDGVTPWDGAGPIVRRDKIT